jgi:enoyl-CoA hydratase/carnithine racemase
MGENLLLTERKDRAFWITLNRPERRNALSPLLLYQLAELLKNLKQEDEIRYIILRGAGDKAFSSGYDITAIPTNVSPKVLEELRKKNPWRRSLKPFGNFPTP